MSVHTDDGQVLNVVPHHGGVRILVECADEVCEPAGFALSADQWSSLVAQGFVILAKSGE